MVFSVVKLGNVIIVLVVGIILSVRVSRNLFVVGELSFVVVVLSGE